MSLTGSEQANTTARDLIQRCLEGNFEAFGSLMESQQRYAYALAFRLLHDDEDAKDVVQDAFIRVWSNLKKYRPEVKFTTWLYKIVVNLCYDRMKMESRRNRVFGYLTGLVRRSDPADSRDLHKEVEGKDLHECILAAARKLPPMEKLIFHLRDVQDFSVEEVAEIARTSIGSVKTNLCFARKRIRTAVRQMQERELR